MNGRRVLAGMLSMLALLLAAPVFAADTVYYYSSDTLHSEVVITDADRNVVERTYYAPYGAVLNRDLRDGPGYSGHEEDPETGLVYMQQRYYCPECGRFLSMDPVGVDPTSGGNFNRYEYAENNPYRYTDPFGTCTGSHISNSDGTCASTGGYTTGSNGAMQGMALARAKESASRPVQLVPKQSNSTQCNAECSNSHVNRAYQTIQKYKIEGSGYSVEYDNEQDADGLTAPNGIVTLGPSAYKSESWLASTLGHEIEIHWDRQFQILGPWKTVGDYYFREVEAYKYNVLNFKRFGNSPEEQTEIYNRLKFNERGYEYYKDKDGL